MEYPKKQRLEGEKDPSIINRRSFLLGAGALTLTTVGAFEIIRHYLDPKVRLEELVDDSLKSCSLETSDSASKIRVAFSDDEHIFDYQDPRVETLNYYSPPEETKARGQLTAGKNSYVISSVTEKDILSRDYADCSGAVFFAQTKDPHHPVAFQTHQDPGAFLYTHKNIDVSFFEDFNKRLQEFIAKTDQDTVSFAFFGGNFFDLPYSESFSNKEILQKSGRQDVDTNMREHYIRSMLLLHKITRTYFPEKTARVIVGPNTTGGRIDVRTCTQEHLLVFRKPEQNPIPKGYNICTMREYLQALSKDQISP
ncbi:hypothetical protein HZC00_00095 [Candidatus Kaiserbacteria bacterium]|nr:hypothetical protein [Candidatus Kaiserbacteria bacterium]